MRDETGAPKKRGASSLLLAPDSYSDSLAPFLTERFSEVHLFDPRDNLSSIKGYVEEHGIDMVLVLNPHYTV